MENNDLFADYKPPAQEIEELRAQIRRHNHLYHVLAQPEIDDYKYDSLFTRLKKLEEEHPELVTPDSPTQEVGGAPIEGFQQVEHSIPMLSLDNSYNVEDLMEFDARVRRGLPSSAVIEYVAELKIDGVSVSLLYRDRELVRAATRGNGRIGDDITTNIKTLNTIPTKLPEDAPDGDIEVRGEVFMPTKGFEKVNAERQEADEPLFANPRNATAGSLKLLDPKITAKRPLDMFAYGLNYEGAQASFHYEKLKTLEKLGFNVEKHACIFNSMEALVNFLSEWENRKNTLPYETDGVVIKVNNPEQQATLGSTSHHPRYAVAFKFPPEKKETKILDIRIQVGRTGALTPVAELEPVFLSGTTVKNATLHNEDEIIRKDIKVGDTVVVQKAGEIIPQVLSVVKEKRTGEERDFEFPRNCPVCGTPVEKPEGEVVSRCPNEWCEAKLKEKIKHFASRQAMDIENLGPAVISQLVDRKMVRDIADLYFLKKEDLLELDGLAEKSASNIIAAIEKSKTPSEPASLIFGLGIRHVGRRGAQILAENFSSISEIAVAGAEKLAELPDFGLATATVVAGFFEQPEAGKVLGKLASAGVALEWERPDAGGPKPLVGKTFVITGALSGHRDDFKKKIESAGGKVSSSVSAKTDYLLCGEDPGSKLEKARKLGVAVIGEKELEELLTGENISEPGLT